jgi:HD-GYP domain-containing protein (c-di-GMP phosphodiesterase class II)
MSRKVSISMHNVKTGMVTAGPVYARNDNGAQVMLVKAKMPLTDAAVDRLHRYGVKSVTIFADGHSGIVVPKIEMPPLPKIESFLSADLTAEAIGGLQDLFAAAAAAGSNTAKALWAVRRLDGVVDRLVETVSGEISRPVHISLLKSHDDYTFYHSLSVAVLSVAIGRLMGLEKHFLRELGRAAIMHDVGKILIPAEILNKRGSLTNKEFEIVKEHSAMGAVFLKKQGIGSKAMWNSIHAHHEKVDGTGYPYGLKGNAIPIFARIISVADMYDAVTSYRPHRRPMSPSAAFEMVSGDVGRAFEYNIVNAFAKTVEFYPIGTTVLLTNDRTGVVINNSNALRPTLQMLDNGEILDLAGLGNLHFVVERVED